MNLNIFLELSDLFILITNKSIGSKNINLNSLKSNINPQKSTLARQSLECEIKNPNLEPNRFT